MFKPSHLKRWQVTLLTVMGAVAGFFLLSLTEVWSGVLCRLALGQFLPWVRLPAKPLPQILSYQWLSLWSVPEFITPILIAGLLLGAQTVWSGLHQDSNAYEVGKVCQRCTVWLMGVLVLWRIYLFKLNWNVGTSALFNSVFFLYCILDPALIWTLVLWRYGVLLQRQAIKDSHVSH